MSQSPPRKRVRQRSTVTTTSSSSSSAVASSSRETVMFDETTPASSTATPASGSGSGGASGAVADPNSGEALVLDAGSASASSNAASAPPTTRGRGRVRMQKKKNSNSNSNVANGGHVTVVSNNSSNNSDNVNNSKSKIVHDEAEDGSEVEEEGGEENGATAGAIGGIAALLRKVPRRSGLTQFDQELVRLVGQHLQSIGLKTSADVLMAEAGVKLIHPNAANFKRFVLSGEWSRAVKCLDDLRNHLDSPDNSIPEMKFLLLEQKYLELLLRGNSLDALKVLQTELSPLKHNQARTHELSSYLMLPTPEEVARVAALGVVPAISGSTGTGTGSSSKSSSKSNGTTSSTIVIPASTNGLANSRQELLHRLQSFLPPTVMLPPGRLMTLIDQAGEFQIDRCLRHSLNPAKGGLNAPLNSSYLTKDHQCSDQDFPCETLQVLKMHSEEIWYCKFSPDGLRLASGGKDNHVIIWDFDPDTMTLKHARNLEGHEHGVGFFAWSPDSTRLAVCGPEDCDEVCIWNVESGHLSCKISHSSEDSLTSVTWSPDGRKIACGGIRGQFYQCDLQGQITDSWEGVRVQAMCFRKDSKTILAADTHHRIRSYNLEETSDFSLIQEHHGIMAFTLDDSDRYALLSIASQGMHLWNIEDRTLVKQFTGMSQGFFTIHSCFGGSDGNFIASGSEDNKVYIFHVNRSTPVAELTGHTRTVNCVSWNPVYPRVLVSASDDSTLRVWAPSEKYRQNSASSETAKSNGHVNGEASGSNPAYFGNGVV